MQQQTRVLVVCWEGADWGMLHPLIDSGQMPHFESIVNEGTIGELATLQPQLDPLLAASLATGCGAERHDVLDFFAVDGGAARPTLSSDCKSPAVWKLLNGIGLRTHVIGWPAYPAESIDGMFVSNLFSRHGDGTVDFQSLPRSVSPPDTAAELAALRVLPTEITSAELLPFVPRAADVDQANDPALAIIATWLAEWMTTHNVATQLLERDDWDFAWIHYDAIDRFGHVFMRFHPPRMAGIERRSHALYQHVMMMVYRFADMQLGRLIELAGEGATIIVCSPHGFRNGADRPKPTNHRRSNVVWHRSLGVLAMRGPAIRRDQWLWGGTLLDVCPTILALFGLKGADIDGRPLAEGFGVIAADRHKGESHATAFDADSAAAIDEHETKMVLQLLVDDGYLEPGTPISVNTAQRAVDARAFNLAQVHLHAGRVAKAAEVLESLVVRRPLVGRFALQLAHCRLALGDRRGCQQLSVKLSELHVPAHYVRCLNADLHLADKNYALALDDLFDVEQAHPHLPGIHRQIGDIYLATQRWDESKRAYQKELERDADDPAALYGLGCVAEAHSSYEQAADYFIQSLATRRSYPEAHFALARALEKLGRLTDAIASVERCLTQRPNFQEAKKLLDELKCRTTRAMDSVIDGGS